MFRVAPSRLHAKAPQNQGWRCQIMDVHPSIHPCFSDLNTKVFNDFARKQWCQVSSPFAWPAPGSRPSNAERLAPAAAAPAASGVAAAPGLRRPPGSGGGAPWISQGVGREPRNHGNLKQKKAFSLRVSHIAKTLFLLRGRYNSFFCTL